MKAIISYFMILVASFSYMLLFDAKVGATMFIFLIVTLIVSVFVTMMTRKKLSFSIESENEVLKKGEHSKVSVIIRKNTFFPVPLITFSLKSSPRFESPEYEQYRFSMSENKSVSIDIDIIPQICGAAYVKIDDIYISDYLGIFRFKIAKDINLMSQLFIKPDIASVEENSELFRSIYNIIPDNDDESSDTSVSKSGFPGYEYREYVPGDSPKRINWKLSIKKNKLFVRLDESTGVSMPRIIIDNSLYTQTDDMHEIMHMQEKILECSLGVLMICIKNGVECMYSFIDNGVARTETISSAEDVENLAGKMSRLVFDADTINYSYSEKSKSTDINILFTLDVTEKISVVAENAILGGDIFKIIVPEASVAKNNFCSADMWMIGDNYTVSRVI